MSWAGLPASEWSSMRMAETNGCQDLQPRPLRRLRQLKYETNVGEVVVSRDQVPMAGEANERNERKGKAIRGGSSATEEVANPSIRSQDASPGKTRRTSCPGSPGPPEKMSKAMLMLCIVTGGLAMTVPPASSRSNGKDWEKMTRSELKTNETRMWPTEIIFRRVEPLHKAPQ